MKSKLVENTWWKAVVCGMAMVTFTGVVGIAHAMEAKPVQDLTKEIGMVQAVDTQGIDGEHFVLQKENATPEKRGLYISHRPAHFRVNMYGTVKGVHWIDKVVPTDSGHMVGILVDFDENTTMMITRRDNKPTQGVFQERWNTTWYDQPIQGMTDEEYMAIWRREDSRTFEKYIQLTGGLLWREDMTAARWDRSVQMTPEGPKVRFTVDMILKDDPTHRYVITFTYDDIQEYSIESLKHLVDILEYLPDESEADAQQNEKQQTEEQRDPSLVDEGYSLPSALLSDMWMETKDVTNLEDLYHQELSQNKPSVRKEQELRITDEGITSQSTWDDTSKTKVTIQRSGRIELEKE
ncbi:hypothetical protein [Veillonella sp. VA139]|uniref:hypothetical protein n=1 Tax=Veillonella sp. VA139 TaxID=741830 RepID=UPI000F8F0ED1|nr:hypothetical protein [Veillonella sp. VA139]